MKKYSLLAAAYLGLSACAPLSGQEVKTPLVDVGDSGTTLEVTLKTIPAEISLENELSTGDKIEAILKRLSQPGEYRISGVYLLDSKDLTIITIKMYFSYCDYRLQLDYCNPNPSLMININSNGKKRSEIFLADSLPYGSLDFFVSCSERIYPCRKNYPKQKDLAYEIFTKIVNEGYREMIKDEEYREKSKNKLHFIDKKIELIFRKLTDF